MTGLRICFDYQGNFIVVSVGVGTVLVFSGECSSEAQRDGDPVKRDRFVVWFVLYLFWITFYEANAAG